MGDIFRASDAADRLVPTSDCSCKATEDYRVIRELKASGACVCTKELTDDAVLYAQAVNPHMPVGYRR